MDKKRKTIKIGWRTWLVTLCWVTAVAGGLWALGVDPVQALAATGGCVSCLLLSITLLALALWLAHETTRDDTETP